MKLLKRIYLRVLAGWLLLCGLRAVLIYAGDFNLAYFENLEGAFVFSMPPMQGEIPLPRFTELNKRLAAVQPGAQFFFAPAAQGEAYMGVMLVPLSEERAEMSPAANEVLRAWEQENERLYPPEYAGYPMF